MIDLGLARVSRLLQQSPQAWRAIHVAGTNGKGSICAYLSAMLQAGGKSCGRFTSPHLIDRWDCISINQTPVSQALFQDAERMVRQRDLDGRLGATEFELLTATAFEIFHQERVKFGVVEVGLGGRLDATNAMKHKEVAVISKVGLDHQSFLGNTLEEIARQKAGIMQAKVPCVVDSSNASPVLQVLEQHAKHVGADVVLASSDSFTSELSDLRLEPHQAQNMACAIEAFRLACPDSRMSPSRLVEAMTEVRWPGRLEEIDIGRLTGREDRVLLDGAHNSQSADALAAYVNKVLRPQDPSVTWLLAASAGKDIAGILRLLLKPQDKVVAVQFGPVDGMPWVQAEESSHFIRAASNQGLDGANLHDGGSDIISALKHASKAAGRRPLVIAGSLYLVSDVLRLLRSV